MDNAWIFQPTRPVGGGTGGKIFAFSAFFDFNPPALWGAGQLTSAQLPLLPNFNPPALWGAGRQQ